MKRAPVAVSLFLMAIPVALSAHAVVYPDVAPPGAYQRYVLRVPNERDRPTVRVELEFPAEVRVVSFGEVPGWSIEVDREGGRIVSATWSGTLPPERFVDLPFVAVNPGDEVRLRWPAVQVYADGERVEWTGPEESSTPASFTRVATEDGGADAGIWVVSLIALVTAMVALGLALRPRQDRA